MRCLWIWSQSIPATFRPPHHSEWEKSRVLIRISSHITPHPLPDLCPLLPAPPPQCSSHPQFWLKLPHWMTWKEAKEGSPAFKESFSGDYFGLLSAKRQRRNGVHPGTCWRVGAQAPQASKAVLTWEVGSQGCPHVLVTLRTSTHLLNPFCLTHTH